MALLDFCHSNSWPWSHPVLRRSLISIWQHASHRKAVWNWKRLGVISCQIDRLLLTTYQLTTHEFPKGRVQSDILEQTSMNKMWTCNQSLNLITIRKLIFPQSQINPLILSFKTTIKLFKAVRAVSMATSKSAQQRNGLLCSARVKSLALSVPETGLAYLCAAQALQLASCTDNSKQTLQSVCCFCSRLFSLCAIAVSSFSPRGKHLHRCWQHWAQGMMELFLGVIVLQKMASFYNPKGCKWHIHILRKQSAKYNVNAVRTEQYVLHPKVLHFYDHIHTINTQNIWNVCSSVLTAQIT